MYLIVKFMYTFQFSFTVYMSNNDGFIYSIVLETEVEDANSKHMETEDSPVKENDEEAVDQQEGESQEECSNDLEGFDANKCYKSWEEYTDGQELSR